MSCISLTISVVCQKKKNKTKKLATVKRFKSTKLVKRNFFNDGEENKTVIMMMIHVNEQLFHEPTLDMSWRYPTSTGGIIVLLKTPIKHREFFPTLFVKTTDFQLVFNSEQTRTVTIFGEHVIMAHIP